MQSWRKMGVCWKEWVLGGISPIHPRAIVVVTKASLLCDTGEGKKHTLLFHRYEEAEVRKKLEERDRQELQNKQEPKDDGKSSAKSSSEATADGKGKSQRVIEVICKFSSSVVV